MPGDIREQLEAVVSAARFVAIEAVMRAHEADADMTAHERRLVYALQQYDGTAPFEDSTDPGPLCVRCGLPARPWRGVSACECGEPEAADDE